eukprot:gb/GECH01004767.1/.p1 GENE.gb/GECH01004767.1/~~gb/GECH01004767.1/.p1  ORF type:complete len:678 (+),score=50.18 gb/GECH01004767.1/:1-2034(+)
MREIEEHESDTTLVSNIVQEASSSAKNARNQGLAHNLFSLNPDKIGKQLKDDILPAHEHFLAIADLRKNKEFSKSIITLNEIGRCLVKLGLAEEAVTHFEKARDLISPEETTELKLSSMGVTQTFGEVNVIDIDEEFFGIDGNEFNIRNNLAMAYLSSGNLKKAYEHAAKILNELNLLAIRNQATPKLTEQVIANMNNMSHCLMEENNYEKARPLLEAALKIMDNDQVKLHLCANYIKNQEYKQAYESLMPMLNNQRPVIKFHVLEHYVTLKWNGNLISMDTAEQSINEMHNLFEDNLGLFKEEYSDSYLLHRLTPLNLRSKLLEDKILKEPSESENELKELSDIEQKAQSIITRISNPKLQKDRRIADLYIGLSDRFSATFNHKLNSNGNLMPNLEKAREYFDKAIETGNASSVMVKAAAKNLAVAYSNYGQFYVKNEASEFRFLEKALQIQQQYQINSQLTEMNLGICYHNLGEQNYDKSKYSEAHTEHAKAVDYLIKATRVDSGSGLSQSGLIKAYKALATSYERKADADYWNLSQSEIRECYKESLLYYNRIESIKADTPESLRIKREVILRKLNTVEENNVFANKVMDAFNSLKKKIQISGNNVEIEVHICDNFKNTLRNHGFPPFDLDPGSLEFEGDSCLITLDATTKEILRARQDSSAEEGKYYYSRFRD